jgi:hypothetical protein
MHQFHKYNPGFFLEKIHKGENINGEGAKRPSGGEGVHRTGRYQQGYQQGGAELLKI